MSRGPKGSALLDGKSTVRWANLWSHGGKFLFENFTASFVFEQERSSLSLGKWAHYPRESELLLIECWRSRKATHPFPTSQVHKCSLQKQSLFFYEKTLLLPCAAFFQPVYKTCRKPRARLGRRRRRERNGLGEEVVPRFCPLHAELIVELVSLPRSGWSQDNTRIRWQADFFLECIKSMELKRRACYESRTCRGRGKVKFMCKKMRS